MVLRFAGCDLRRDQGLAARAPRAQRERIAVQGVRQRSVDGSKHWKDHPWRRAKAREAGQSSSISNECDL
eukprot:5014923-Alexandrium_andersonii.AAC.1